MHEAIATLIVAGYPDLDRAAADCAMLNELDLDSEAELVHADVSRFAQRESSDTSTTRAAASGVAEWDLLSTFVGRDRRATRLVKGLSRRDVRELAALIERSPFVLVAVMSGHGADRFVGRLTSSDLLVKRRTSANVGFSGLLQRYNRSGRHS